MFCHQPRRGGRKSISWGVGYGEHVAAELVYGRESRLGGIRQGRPGRRPPYRAAITDSPQKRTCAAVRSSASDASNAAIAS